jgi:hypothetical protein
VSERVKKSIGALYHETIAPTLSLMDESIAIYCTQGKADRSVTKKL